MNKKCLLCSENNSYYNNRVKYIINHLLNSKAGGYHLYYNASDEPVYYYIKSTFPNYTRFAYKKKPKNYNLLTDKEKIGHCTYYAWNTKDIIRTLNLTLNNKKLNTNLQRKFIDELFYYFSIYEQDYFEEHNEKLFDDVPDLDMSLCPF